jgi:cytidylate kinase
MQFFTAQGMKEATGYGEPKDWYFVIVKELLDNAIDWSRDNCKGSADVRVTASFIISEDGTKLNCKVRNSNPKNIHVYAFTQLHNILNYNMTFGSKQNEYRATRGQLGDGLKRIMGLPFILMNMGDDTSAFFKKQWDIPMCFRANGIEHQALVKVNLGASEAINQITVSSVELPHTDTEIEVTLPIINEVKSHVTLPILEKHCRLSTFATTDISFDIEIIDEAAQAKGYAGKAVIHLEAKHPIPKNLHNSTSILIYRPAEFVNRIESIDDRENTSVYQVIRKFEEGAQMPKSVFDKLLDVADVNRLSLADFMNRPDYQTKMLALHNVLMEEADK